MVSLLAQARRVTRRRREPTDWYTILLGVLVLAGFPVQVLIGVATRADGTDKVAVVPLAFTLGMAVVGVAAALVAAMAVGPLRMSAAEYTAVLSAPVDRRAELRARWFTGLGIAGVGGAVAAVAAALLSDVRWAAAAWLGVAGAAVGLTVMGTATGLQAAAETVRRGVRQGAAGVAGTALAVGSFLTAQHVSMGLGSTASGAAAVVAVAAAVPPLRWGWRTVAELDRRALTAGNALATAAGASAVYLDPTLLGGVLAQRQSAGGRVSRSRSFPRGRVRALIAADLVRSTRNRRGQALVAGALLACYAAATVLPARWVPVVVLLAAVTAVSPFAVGLRQICGSPVLRRMLGGRDSALRSAHLAVPVVLTILFAVAAAVITGNRDVAVLVVAPIGVIANLWLRATAKPAEFGSRTADVGFGPIPVDLTLFVIRGVGPLVVTALIQLTL